MFVAKLEPFFGLICLICFHTSADFYEHLGINGKYIQAAFVFFAGYLNLELHWEQFYLISPNNQKKTTSTEAGTMGSREFLSEKSRSTSAELHEWWRLLLVTTASTQL